MNKQNLNMPLQHTSKFKTISPDYMYNNNKNEETPLNAVNTDQQLLYAQSADKKYDLPCQRQKDQYLFAPYIQNRPATIKNMYHNASKFSVETKPNEQQSPTNVLEQHLTNGPTKSRVTSIYQRLLQQNKKKNERCLILTQTTFKPKQIKTELSRINTCHHQSTEHLQSVKKSNQKTNSSKKKIQQLKSRDSAVGKNGRTKYERILQEHFQFNYNSKKKEPLAPPTIQDVRLSKIYTNSTLIKLKGKIFSPVLQYSSKINKEKVTSFIQNTKQKKITLTNQNRTSQKNQNCNIQLNQQQYKRSKQYKNEQMTQMGIRNNSKRWMSMNFYERQQKVLSNRKQKESIGKQKNIEKEIRPCTFKPELIKKSKSLKTMPAQKQTYLQLYYDRLYKKY